MPRYHVNNPFPVFGQFTPDLDAKDDWFSAPGDDGCLDAPEYMPAGGMFGVKDFGQYQRACHAGYRRSK